MRLKGKIMLLGLAIVMVAAVIEMFLQEVRQEVWEKFTDNKNSPVDLGSGVNSSIYSNGIANFEQYCARFGKSYKNLDTYNIRKKEF